MIYLALIVGILSLFLGSASSVEFDGSQIPQDCTIPHFDDYFRQHEYNCSRFWKCHPFEAGDRPEDRVELFECPYCDENHNKDCPLVFDMSINQCNWNNGNIDCSRHPAPETTERTTPTTTPSTTTTTTTTTTSTTTTTTTTTITTTTTVHELFCTTSADCTDRCGGDCCNQRCKYPDCCADADCDNALVCHPLSRTCVECHANYDCISSTGCQGSCVDSMCSYPECCTDLDCQHGYVCNPHSQMCVAWQTCNGTQSDCYNWNNLCNTDRYENCRYCDESVGACRLGCGQDANCPSLYTPTCNLATHTCGCWSKDDCRRSSRNHVCDLATNTCVSET